MKTFSRFLCRSSGAVEDGNSGRGAGGRVQEFGPPVRPGAKVVQGKMRARTVLRARATPLSPLVAGRALPSTPAGFEAPPRHRCAGSGEDWVCFCAPVRGVWRPPTSSSLVCRTRSLLVFPRPPLTGRRPKDARMRRGASLCGATACCFGGNTPRARFRLLAARRVPDYAGSCIRTSGNDPSRQSGE